LSQYFLVVALKQRMPVRWHLERRYIEFLRDCEISLSEATAVALLSRLDIYKERLTSDMKHLAKMTLIAAAIASSTAFAQDKPDGLWHGSVNLGASFANQAVRTSSIVASFDTARKTEIDKLSFYGLAQRGETKVLDVKAVTTDLYRLGGRYDRDFNKQLFGFVGAEFERNGVIDLDLRSSANVGLGYHVIATPTTTFDVFAGVGYNHYDFSFGSDGSGEALIGEESSHKISDTTTYKQKGVVYQAFDNDLGFRATWDHTLAVAMGGGWNMNLTGSIRHANKVFVGKKTETLLTIGLGYKF
jgi:putative salt-induced outer membrane protein